MPSRPCLGQSKRGTYFAEKRNGKLSNTHGGCQVPIFFPILSDFSRSFLFSPFCSCALQNSLLNGNKTVVELLHCCSDMTCISLMFSLHSIAFFWSTIISQRNFLLSFDISQGQHTWLIWRISEASCLRHRTSYFLATFLHWKTLFFYLFCLLLFLTPAYVVLNFETTVNSGCPLGLSYSKVE